VVVRLKETFNAPKLGDAAEKLCNGSQSPAEQRAVTRLSTRCALGGPFTLHWCREETEFDICRCSDRPIRRTSGNSSASVAGQRAPSRKPPDFFVLALSANAARIVVR